MWERTITIDSMGKTFSVTGWKVGWAIAPPPLTAALRAVHQFVTFTNSAPFQEALADVLPAAARERLLRRAARRLRAPADLLAARFRERGPAPLPIDGAYFLLTDSARWLRRRRRLLPAAGDRDRRRGHPDVGLLRRPDTAPPVARFCFAKRDETINAAATRLARLRAGA